MSRRNDPCGRVGEVEPRSRVAIGQAVSPLEVARDLGPLGGGERRAETRLGDERGSVEGGWGEDGVDERLEHSGIVLSRTSVESVVAEKE